MAVAENIREPREQSWKQEQAKAAADMAVVTGLV